MNKAVNRESDIINPFLLSVLLLAYVPLCAQSVDLEPFVDYRPAEGIMGFSWIRGGIPNSPTGQVTLFSINAYWAYGQGGGIRIPDPVLLFAQVPLQLEGQHPIYYIPPFALQNRPSHATHVAFYVDWFNSVLETDENNNVLVFALDQTFHDLKPGTLSWAGQNAGLTYSYVVQGAALTQGTTLDLYWASGPRLADKLPVASILTSIIPFGPPTNSPAYAVAQALLNDPPAEATHVLLILDPQNRILESNETNNLRALPVPPPFIWKTPGVNGYFAHPQNWLSGTIPTNTSSIILSNNSAVPTTILFDATIPSQTYKAHKLEVKSGTWNLDLTEMRRLNGQPNALYFPYQIVGPAGITVGSDATLKVIGRALGTPALETTTLRLENRAGLSASLGTIQINGDLDLSFNADELRIELPTVPNLTTPLLRVLGTFRAGRTLKFILPPGYIPKPGDRFRIVEFTAGTKDVQEIHDRFRFKAYDPEIPEIPGGTNFWGLIFRDEGAQQIIEAVVLKQPVLPNGLVLRPSDANGLVFVTHGTFSEIDLSTNSSGIGQLPLAIGGFLERHGNGTWDVASLDWGEISTGLPGPNGFFLNPATSAQVGIGIAESLVHWMRHKGFQYSRVHLLSHSSGSWLVNRMAQQLKPGAQVHLTFFDAFTRPAETGDCLYCSRFIAILGEGSNDPGDFVEHYLDRNGIWDLPGTGNRLARAVNYDVTFARIDLPPYHTARLAQESGVDYWDTNSLSFIDVIDAGLKAHSWPYLWYLETIRQTSASNLDYECGGFAFAPEVLDSRVWPSEIRNRIFATKSALRRGDEFLIKDGDCRFHAPSVARPAQTPFANPELMPSGSYSVLNGGNGIHMETAPSGASFRSLSAQGQIAGFTVQIDFPCAVEAIEFQLQFTAVSNGLLRVSVDDAIAKIIPQNELGTNVASSGLVVFIRPIGPGVHHVHFSLETTGTNAVGITLQGLTLHLETHARFFPPILSEALHLKFTGLPETNYAVEASSDLFNWVTLTNVFSPTGTYDAQVPLSPSQPLRFFRAALTEQ